MPEAVKHKRLTASEALLPKSEECLLVQWALITTSSGAVNVVETTTDITSLKQQQVRSEQLIKRLSAANCELLYTNEQLRDQSSRDGFSKLFNHSHFQQTLVHCVPNRSVLWPPFRSCSSTSTISRASRTHMATRRRPSAERNGLAAR